MNRLKNWWRRSKIAKPVYSWIIRDEGKFIKQYQTQFQTPENLLQLRTEAIQKQKKPLKKRILNKLYLKKKILQCVFFIFFFWCFPIGTFLF